MNYPEHYVRHCSGLGFIDKNDKSNAGCNPAAFKADVSFRLVPGLSRGDGVSFESVNYPGQFLRHQGWRIKLAPSDGSDLFEQDATFTKVPGLAGKGSSFRSVDYPNMYLRHCSAELYMDENSGSNNACASDPAIYKQDVSFNIVPALGR